MRIKSQQDLGAGLLLIAIGAGGLLFGRELTFGSAARMGPGFFPLILSWLIVGFGVLIAARAVTLDGEAIEAIRLRPLGLVVAAIVAFALMVERTGLALAVLALVALAGCARPNPSAKELAALAVALSLGAVGVFVYALGQPIPAWWGR